MTNDILDMHRPTEAFRDYLEGEVIHEFRKRRTFRRLRAAAVVVFSIGLGMSATLASAQVRENAQRDSILEAAKADLLLSSVRVELAKMQYAETQKRVSVGAELSATLADAEDQLRSAEHEFARFYLNTAEIEATGLPPRDELNAPLVKGKDYVKQRLDARMMMVNRRLQSAERARDEAKRRAAVGAISELEAAELELAVVRARGELVTLNERLKARAEFLQKGTPIEELARRIERVEVQQEIATAQQGFTNAKSRLELLERRQQVGAATELDVLKARVDLKEREIEMQRLSRRLKQVQNAGRS